MIDRDHQLPITRQAELLEISRGAVYYLPRPVSPADLALMRRIDELHLEHPFMGARMLRNQRDNVFVERLWRSVKYERVYQGLRQRQRGARRHRRLPGLVQRASRSLQPGAGYAR